MSNDVLRQSNLSQSVTKLQNIKHERDDNQPQTFPHGSNSRDKTPQTYAPDESSSRDNGAPTSEISQREYENAYLSGSLLFDDEYKASIDPHLSEYEEWANEGDSDSLLEINSPHEVATNDPHAANPTTCERGRKMYPNDTSTPVDGVPPTPKISHSSDIDYSQSVIHINQNYLGDSISEACKHHKFLNVRSDMGTGKTTAMKTIINSLDPDTPLLFISPRKKLNLAMSYDLGLNYYEDVKKEPDIQRKKQMAQRMVVTPQSFGSILSLFPDLEYRYIVMDEGESKASMLVSSIVDDKERTLDALKNAASKAGNVVAMDAHLGKKTNELMNILSSGSPVALLNNKHKRWNHIQVDMISGGRYTDRRKTSDALQIKAIEKGERIAISSSSAEYCEARFKALSELYPDLRIKKITGKDSLEAREILENPDTLLYYDIIIFSPAVSIGVSFDIKNHIDTVFGVYVNTDKTGDTDDAIQGLARIRHPKSNKWVVVLDDDKRVMGDMSVISSEILDALVNRITREKWHIGDKSVSQSAVTENQIAELYAVCESIRRDDKNNYVKRFESRLNSMGASITRISFDSVTINDDSERLREEYKQEKKESEEHDKTASKRISEDGFNKIRMKKRFSPESVTDDEKASYKRFIFESRYNINCDDLSSKDLQKYLALDDNEAISKCRNREIALSSSDFANRYMKARLIGLGDNEAFKVDIVSEKLNFRLIRKLYGYAVPYFDGENYSHKELKRSALMQFVKRHHSEIVALNVMSLPKGWEQKPALLMNKLLQSMGFKTVSSRSSHKNDRTWRAVTDADIQGLYEARLLDGRNWVEATSKLLDVHTVKAISSLLTEDEVKRLYMPQVDIKFLHDQLKAVPDAYHIDIVTEWMSRYDMFNSGNAGMDAPAQANNWLREKVGDIVMCNNRHIKTA